MRGATTSGLAGYQAETCPHGGLSSSEESLVTASPWLTH